MSKYDDVPPLPEPYVPENPRFKQAYNRSPHARVIRTVCALSLVFGVGIGSVRFGEYLGKAKITGFYSPAQQNEAFPFYLTLFGPDNPLAAGCNGDDVLDFADMELLFTNQGLSVGERPSVKQLEDMVEFAQENCQTNE